MVRRGCDTGSSAGKAKTVCGPTVEPRAGARERGSLPSLIRVRRVSSEVVERCDG